MPWPCVGDCATALKPPVKGESNTLDAGHAVNSQPSAIRPFKDWPSCWELPHPCHTLHRATNIHWRYIDLAILAQLRTTWMDHFNSRASHVINLQLSLGPHLGLTLSAHSRFHPLFQVLIPILQARILEWVAIPFSRGSSQPRDRIQVSCIADRFFTIWATREAPLIPKASPNK